MVESASWFVFTDAVASITHSEGSGELCRQPNTERSPGRRDESACRVYVILSVSLLAPAECAGLH